MTKRNYEFRKEISNDIPKLRFQAQRVTSLAVMLRFGCHSSFLYEKFTTQCYPREYSM